MAENDQRRPSLQGIDAKICESGLRRDVYLTGTSLKFLFFFRCADCYVCVLSFVRFSWLAPVLGLPRGEKQRPIERENIEPQSIRVHLGEDKAIIANWMICDHLEPLFILLFSPEISLNS